MPDAGNTVPPAGQRSLGKRASSATIWLVGARFAQQVIGFARILVLARLLAPEDFGLMGVAVSALAITQLFAVTGFLGALVQRPGDISKAINTAWTIELGRNFLIAGVLLAAASSIAGFLDTPAATPILQALAGIFAINGFKNVATVYLRRDLRVKDELSITFGATVMEAIVTITLALTMGSVWALVWGALARSLTMVTISYLVYPHVPKIEFNRAEAASMFKFARWLSLSAMTIQLIHQVDRLIVARVLGTMALGFYTVSDRFSLNPVRELGGVGLRVGFPALAKLQANRKELADKSLATLDLSLSIVMPVALASFILVEEFVPVILGNQWTGAIEITKVMMLAAIPMTLTEVGSIPLVAYGIPKVAAAATLTALIIILVTMPLFARAWGLDGAGIAMALGYGVASVMILLSWHYRLGIRYRHILKSLLSGAILATATALPLLIVDNLHWSNLTQTIVGAVVFVAVYGAAATLLWFVAKKGPLRVVTMAMSRAR